MSIEHQFEHEYEYCKISTGVVLEYNVFSTGYIHVYHFEQDEYYSAPALTDKHVTWP